MIDVLREFPNLSPDEALQAGLDLGGHVIAGPAAYQQNLGSLRIKENTYLQVDPSADLFRTQGIGMLRNRHEGDAYPGYTGRGNITIDGGNFRGQGHLPGATAQPASIMTFAHAENVTLRNVNFYDVPGLHALDLIGLRNVHVENCHVYGFKATPDDATIREAIQVDGSYGAYSGDSFPADLTPCDDVTITGCRFTASSHLPAPRRAVGSHGYPEDVAGHEHRNVKVIDNTMSGVTDAAVWAWLWKESVISGNHVEDAGGSGIVVKDGSYHVTVEGNHVYDPRASGVWVNGGCSNVTIHGNRVIGAGAGVHNTHFGVRVSGSCSIVEITTNKIRKRGTGNHAKYGLSIAQDCSGIQRYGNDLRSSGVTGSLQDLSPSSVTSAADVT